MGATWVEPLKAWNFALYSRRATGVTLLLYSEKDLVHPVREIRLNPRANKSGRIWHCWVTEEQAPGACLYAYRVEGRYVPSEGYRFDASKILLDPFARSVIFPPDYDRDAAIGPGANDGRAPLGVLPTREEADFEWGESYLPRHSHDLIVYELHVKGFTARENSGVTPERRGTFAGLAEKIPYLISLGVTAVELMPVHQFVPEHDLAARGLTNYWGYNTIGFLAPHDRYSSSGQRGGQVGEFKAMVKALHEAGIEVILDVVYNHTAESDHRGPTLSFRGIDNAAYYQLRDDDRRYYLDYTGCGNSLNVRHPHALQLIMDSLRYWVLEMHVDGFRFDLASALARELHKVDRLAAFFDLVQQDPVVSQVKLIAEPWDVGEGGYQVGNFPPLWSEWNGQYRDAVRDFWRGRPDTLPQFASRLTGSSDLYETSGRRPFASINFVTCHDGFTLSDLVSYNHKHNEANAEGGADGSDDNRSWNCGVEGPTGDPAVNELRRRQRRNFLVTLFCSQGVPMLLAGDELGRTQLGNNNAYCQDNKISWVDWEHASQEKDLQEFTRALAAFRRRHPVFRRRRFFDRPDGRAAGAPGDIAWLTPSGREMTDNDWNTGYAKALGVFLNGDAISEPDPRGERVRDDTFLLLFSADSQPVTFTLPAARFGPHWTVVLDTASPAAPDDPPAAAPPRPRKAGARVVLRAHSMMLLRRVRPESQ